MLKLLDEILHLTHLQITTYQTQLFNSSWKKKPYKIIIVYHSYHIVFLPKTTLLIKILPRIWPIRFNAPFILQSQNGQRLPRVKMEALVHIFGRQPRRQDLHWGCGRIKVGLFVSSLVCAFFHFDFSTECVRTCVRDCVHCFNWRSLFRLLDFRSFNNA